MRKALAAAVVAALAFSGCGGTDEDATDTPSVSESVSPDTSKPKPSPSQDMTDDSTEEGNNDDGIEIEIEGSRVEPNGKRVQVEADEPVRLEIESDRAGELHVHSSPDQEIAFKQGESVLKLTVDTPGIVDVEDHESGTVILQLEVR